ncbi:hypothetical protein EYC84_001637 [Monilinia fructicola]|uniref:Uncharacterized protein n=1 Tax=Monilinia fructicola TaxID=38448 RepID=A0A5M9JQ69_MONFR|nr:hypothetical protein EYC84_001637 [Monilinia fructicola]
MDINNDVGARCAKYVHNKECPGDGEMSRSEGKHKVFVKNEDNREELEEKRRQEKRRGGGEVEDVGHSLSIIGN